MALKKCKECGEEISTKAKVCPKCGAPQKAKQYTISQLALVIVLVMFIYSLFSSDPKPSKTYTNSSPKKTISSVDKKAKLEECAKALVEKNQNMMRPPAVGNWKTIDYVEAYVTDDNKIELVYTTNDLFTDKIKSDLELVQRLFIKSAGCSPSDLQTWAQ